MKTYWFFPLHQNPDFPDFQKKVSNLIFLDNQTQISFFRQLLNQKFIEEFLMAKLSNFILHNQAEFILPLQAWFLPSKSRSKLPTFREVFDGKIVGFCSLLQIGDTPKL